jgi:hypothetical protein
MQTVELIVYLGIAVIIGGLVLGFIIGIDTEDVYNALKSMLYREEKVSYQSVDSSDLAPVIYSAWRECGYGQKDYELIISLKSGDNVTKEYLFDSYRKFNLCYSIQSADNDCGNREDLTLDPELINSPALLMITCNSSTESLIVKTI